MTSLDSSHSYPDDDSDDGPDRPSLRPAVGGTLLAAGLIAGALVSVQRGADPGAVLVQAGFAGYCLRTVILLVTAYTAVVRWEKARAQWAEDDYAGHLPDYPRTTRPSRLRTQVVFSALIVAPAAAVLCLLGDVSLLLLAASLLTGGIVRELGALLDGHFHPGRATGHARP